MSTRRKFLQQTMAVTGGLLATQAFGFPFIARKPTVIVLGAGISGLAAADLLARKGAHVTVLEARNRMGGRIFSHRPKEANGLVMELGAEWIGADHKTMLALCDRFNLQLNDNRFDVHLLERGRYIPHGKWGHSLAWEHKWGKLLAEFKAMNEAERMQLDSTDFHHYLLKQGCESPDLDRMDLNDSTEFGESIRHVSAYMAMEGHLASGDNAQMDYKLKGGNDTVIHALGNAVGKGNIRLEHEVINVEQSESGVKVTCRNGETLEADKLICTLPVFAAQRIDWKPGLPQALLQAMNELNYGRINKHAVMYDKRFWKDEAFSLLTDMPAHFIYHATKDQPGPAGILISYSIGDKAEIFGRYKDVPSWPSNALREALAPLFGNTAESALRRWNYDWSTDPYSCGAYAIYNKHQWTRLKPVLERPYLHTHFAGEHLDDWQGFMEGAANSGIAAANAILG